MFSGLILGTASVCAATTQLRKKKLGLETIKIEKNHKILHASHLDVLNTAQVASFSISVFI